MPLPWGFACEGDWGFGCADEYGFDCSPATWGFDINGSTDWGFGCATEPILAVEDVTQNSGSIVIYDRLNFTVTIPDDGRVTTSVVVYEDGNPIATLIEKSTRVWTGSYNIQTDGLHTYTAIRTFITGSLVSNAVDLNVLGALEPDDITSATLIAWYRNTESIRCFTTLAGAPGNRTITIASSSSLDGQTHWPRVDIKLTGVPGTGKFRTTFDGGATYNEASDQTIPTGAGTYAVPNSDYTITFQQAVSYTLNDMYVPMCNAFLDKVGAYPNSTNNLINNASDGGANTRPRPINTVNGTNNNNLVGAPVLRFDTALAVQGFMWNTGGSLATQFSGTDKHMGIYMVCSPTPSQTAATKTLYCISNLTDTDQPRITMSLNTAVTNEPPVLRAGRVSDTGVNTGVSGQQTVIIGSTFICDEFDGTNRRCRYNMVDMIGGDSGVPAIQSGQTITTTRFVVGTQQGQAGKTNGGTLDLAELIITDGPLSEVELWRLAAYILQ